MTGRCRSVSSGRSWAQPMGAALFGALVLTLGSCGGAYIDGKYQGSAEGVHGAVGVEVTVQGGRIQKVDVTNQEESSGVAALALKRIPEEIVKAQSAEVEAVTGASMSSKAIMAATAEALKPAVKNK